MPGKNTKYILRMISQAAIRQSSQIKNSTSPIELPAEKTTNTSPLDEKLLNELVLLGLVTDNEKESNKVSGVITSDENAVVLIFEHSIFTLPKANQVKSWLGDKDIHFVQGDSPNENCFFISAEGLKEVEHLAKVHDGSSAGQGRNLR